MTTKYVNQGVAAEQKAVYSSADALAVGDIVNVDGNQFKVEDADKANGTNGQTQVAPSRDDAVQATGTRAFRMMKKKVAQADKSTEAIAAEAASTECVRWDAGLEYTANQYGCGELTADTTKSYKCLLPDFCGMFEPGTDAEMTSGSIPTINGSDIWDTTNNVIDMVEENTALRTTNDATKYKSGKQFAVGDFITYNNSNYECLEAARCSQTDPVIKPGSTAASGVWQTPQLSTAETAVKDAIYAALDPSEQAAYEAKFAVGTVPDSSKVSLDKWKAGAKKYSTAYHFGALAEHESKVYTCDPEMAGGKYMKHSEFENKSTVNTSGATETVEVISGCCKYAPGSTKGREYWLDISEEAADFLGDIQPEDLVAQPFTDTVGYLSGDLTVVNDIVYECIDDQFCTNSPTSTRGLDAWEATLFKADSITGYDSTGATEPPQKWLEYDSTTEALPFAKNDKIKIGADQYNCTDTVLCRTTTPTDASSGWETYTGTLNDADVVPADELPDAAEEYTVKAVAHDASVTYTQDEIVVGPDTYGTAWSCMLAACGTTLDEASGFYPMRQKGIIQTPEELEAGIVEAYDWEPDVAWAPLEQVNVDQRIYTCAIDRADECQNVDPRDTEEARGVWTATTDMGRSKGKASEDTEIFAEVDALPLHTVLENPSFKMTAGKNFQFDGVVYECMDETAGGCDGVLGDVRTYFEEEEAALKAIFECEKGSTPTQAADCDALETALMEFDIPKKVRDILTFPSGSASGAKWAQTKKQPSKTEEEYDDVDDDDMLALDNMDFVFKCTKIDNPEGFYFKQGDIFCDTAAFEAYECLDERECDKAANNPITVTDKTIPEFLAVWTPVESDVFDTKFFVEEPDTQANQEPTKTYDWTNATASTFTGTFSFGPGSLAIDNERVYECIGEATACQTTQPSVDEEKTTWAITYYEPLEFTAEEIELDQKNIKDCFRFELDFPFLEGDAVCDPDMPEYGMWTCMDALNCPTMMPGLDMIEELEGTWQLTTTNFEMTDGVPTYYNDDVTSDYYRSDKNEFNEVDKPVEGAPVTCKDYEDFDAAATNASIGDDLLWCENGRVYECTENPSSTGVRSQCSNGTYPSSWDRNSPWELVRQRGTVEKLSAAEIDARFPPKEEKAACQPNDTFGAQDLWTGDAKKVEATTENKIKLEGGVVCSEDTEVQRKMASAQVKVVGMLPADRANWPRNAQIIDASFDAVKLETVFKGIGYEHAEDSESFYNIMSWFPSICSDTPEGDARSVIDICKTEMATITVFALSGEPSKAMHEAKTVSTATVTTLPNGQPAADVKWWQTAFVTGADEDCFVREHTGGAMDASAGTDCMKQPASSTNADDLGAVVDTTKAYYKRGSGPLPLEGIEDYTAFSKAITSDETTFGKDPSLVMTYGDKIGEFNGQEVGAMPIAVALWRYVSYPHAFLPSMHDVAVGQWQPRAHEIAAGLESGTFCTITALVMAQKAMHETKDYAMIADANYDPKEAARDGTLGMAYREIMSAFKAPHMSATEYDYSCATTGAWPEPEQADIESRQQIYMRPDTATGKCTFTDEVTAYSIYQEGDSERCFMDSDPTEAAKTVEERRAGNADTRLACLLWDATAPYPWDQYVEPPSSGATGFENEHSLACVENPLCDAACQADPLMAKHIMYKCIDAKGCMDEEPGMVSTTGVSAWELDMTAIPATAGIAGDTSGSAYKVKEPEAVSGETERECMEWDDVMLEAQNPMFQEKFVDVDPQILETCASTNTCDGIRTTPALTVCHRGRAYKCKASDATIGLTMFNDIERCFGLYGGIATGSATSPEMDIQGDFWELVPGVTGKEQARFEQRWPDCLINSYGNDSINFATADAEQARKNTMFAAQKDATTPVTFIVADPTQDATEAAMTGQKYVVEERDDLAIYVNAYGELCTNLDGLVYNSDMTEIKEELEAPAYETSAFVSSVIHAEHIEQWDITVTSGVATTQDTNGLPQNVQTIMAIMDEASFDDIVSNQSPVTDPNDASQIIDRWLTYESFLNAAAQYPGFCNTEGTGRQSGIPASIICRKELAALFTVAVAYTNEGNEAKVDANNQQVPFYEQGFYHRENANCLLDSTADEFAADPECSAFAPQTGYYGQQEACMGLCSPDLAYSWRGPGKMAGVAEYLQFSKTLETDDASVADPRAALRDAKTYWMSGLWKWMTPLNGRPSPNNVITGLWEAGEEEMRDNVPEGFGAIQKLADPTSCGTGARGPKGKMYENIWAKAKQHFGLTDEQGNQIPHDAPTVDYNSWNEATQTYEGTIVETFMPLSPTDSDDCANTSTDPFPAGSFAKFPTYLQPYYMDASGMEVGRETGKCFVTAVPSKYSVHVKDAYRDCAWENRDRMTYN